MSRKKKIILISVAVTLALVLSVGGLASVLADNLHPVPGKNRLLGVGWCAKYEDEELDLWKSTQTLDTMFIITNPNCNRTIHLDRLIIIDEDEEIVYDEEVDIEHRELSPHQVWEFYLSDCIGPVDAEEGRWQPPENVPKYTVEIMWSGVHYSWWRGWRDSPCTGWMKQLITTESSYWSADACTCVGNPCEFDFDIMGCVGECIPTATIPGADCVECGCQCVTMYEMGIPSYCECQPCVCGGWVHTLPVTEVSESEMMVYQPARVR